MTKQEFEQLIGKKVIDFEYKIIEEVYAFHPSISETKGKEQIAYLYLNFGMRIIQDMFKTARIAKGFERDIMNARHKLEALEHEFSRFKNGYINERINNDEE